MKILFVGFNAKYINPTNQLTHRMLKLFSEVVFYGPGFVNDDELQQGLESFSAEHGPFDFICTSTQLAVDSDPTTTDNFYRQFSLCAWGVGVVGGFMADARDFMMHSELPKVVFVMDLDTHGVRADLLEQLDKFANYIVAWGKGFSRPNEELPYLKVEKAYQSKAKVRPLGLWHDFCENKLQKFINIGHFVGLHEFDFSPLSMRPYSVSVAGQLYFSRAKTLDVLRRDKRLKVNSTSYRWIFSLLSKIGFSPYARLIPHTIYRALFKQVLCSSKISMTDGGAYDIMIRKFVEIPASGALLLARPCGGFESLGFVNGESAVLLNEADPVGQVIELLADIEKLQAIAHRGQEVVWEKHSIQARAKQMESALFLILKGKFKGSVWSDGEFILL